jgi:DNA-directed RNA polymerase subunit RPC12/RpoP
MGIMCQACGTEMVNIPQNKIILSCPTCGMKVLSQNASKASLSSPDTLQSSTSDTDAEIGLGLLRSKDYSRAIEKLTSASVASPSDTSIWINLLECYFHILKPTNFENEIKNIQACFERAKNSNADIRCIEVYLQQNIFESFLKIATHDADKATKYYMAYDKISDACKAELDHLFAVLTLGVNFTQDSFALQTKFALESILLYINMVSLSNSVELGNDDIHTFIKVINNNITENENLTHKIFSASEQEALFQEIKNHNFDLKNYIKKNNHLGLKIGVAVVAIIIILSII